MSISNPFKNLPELVRDSMLETRIEQDGPHIRTIHTRPTAHRSARREESWIHEKHLGQGGFGAVSLQRREAGESTKPDLRAVKTMAIPKSDIEAALPMYQRELEALVKFSRDKYSNFFVKFYGWYSTPGYVNLAMDYYSCGDLQSYLECPTKSPGGRLPEAEVRDIALQISEALALMHKEQFAHRDLKPANILIVQHSPYWWIKLCDLGLTKRIGDTAGFTAVMGTPSFMPPELAFAEDPAEVDPYQADIWCFGETIFRALTGRASFTRAGILRYYTNQIEFPEKCLRDLAISEDGIKFVQSVLAGSPSQRLSADQAKSHQWVNNPSNACGDERVETVEDLNESITDSTLQFRTWNTAAYDSEIDDFLADMEYNSGSGPSGGNNADGSHDEKDDGVNLLLSHAKEFYQSREYNEATATFRVVVKLMTTTLGPKHEKTLLAMEYLARSLSHVGRNIEAEELYQGCIEGFRETMGGKHPSTLAVTYSFCVSLYRQHRYSEAEAALRLNLELEKKGFGQRYIPAFHGARLLAEILLAQGRYPDAESHARELLAIVRSTQGREHVDALDPASSLTISLCRQGKFAEAEVVSRQALSLAEKQLGQDHETTLCIRETLATILEHSGTQWTEGELSGEMRYKLAKVEKEYEDISRQTSGTFRSSQEVPRNEATAGPPYVPEDKSNMMGSSTKLSIPRDKLQSRPPNRVHDLEFATEISTALITQVRNLQALLSEKDKQLQDATMDKSRLETYAESLRQRLEVLDGSPH